MDTPASDDHPHHADADPGDDLPVDALYPDDYPEEPAAGITDDEVEDFLATTGKANEAERPQDLPMDTAERLRHFATRTLVCWEGSDADEAVAVLLAAADLLDGDR